MEALAPGKLLSCGTQLRGNTGPDEAVVPGPAGLLNTTVSFTSSKAVWWTHPDDAKNGLTGLADGTTRDSRHSISIRGVYGLQSYDRRERWVMAATPGRKTPGFPAKDPNAHRTISQMSIWLWFDLPTLDVPSSAFPPCDRTARNAIRHWAPVPSQARPQ